MTETVGHDEGNAWWRFAVGLGFWAGGIAVIVGLVAYLSPTAREVLQDAFFYGIAFFGTPFVLEATVAVIGLLTVLTISHWRIHKEGDGWVHLAVPEAGTEDDPAHRLNAVVLKEVPETLDDVETRLAAIEGFIDLGLPEDALEALNRLSPEAQALPKAVSLRSKLSQA